MKVVAVPGGGAYGFQAMGDAWDTTGFDVRFRSEGTEAWGSGSARMRVQIGDALDWSVECVDAGQLDAVVVEAAFEPALAWLEANQVTLMLSVLGAADIERRAIREERKRLTLAHEAGRARLVQDRQGAFAPREASWRSADAVEAARLRLDAFEERVADREADLGLVVDAALRFSQVKTRWTSTFSELMSELRDHAVMRHGSLAMA